MLYGCAEGLTLLKWSRAELAVFAMPPLTTSLLWRASAQAVHVTGLKPVSDWCLASFSFSSVSMSSALSRDLQTALVLLLGLPPGAWVGGSESGLPVPVGTFSLSADDIVRTVGE